MGDLNYRMVGLSGRQVLHLIKNGRTKEMYDKADGWWEHKIYDHNFLYMYSIFVYFMILK